MAQPQQNIHIAAPGFAGLNTQDSPVGMDISFASQADNCIIDQYGRVASREGFQAYTYNPTALTDEAVVVQEFVEEDGDTWVFVCADGDIFLQDLDATTEANRTLGNGTTPGTPLTGTTGTSSQNNWQIIPFNDKCFFVQAGLPTLVFDPATSTTALVGLTAAPVGPTGYPNCATAAFGHLWLADFDDDKSMIFWSVLRDGTDFTGSGTGNIDLTDHWPLGFDQVVSLAAHNNFMVVFGRRSILLFEVPDTGPVNATMVDTIEGLGCLARDSVQSTGSDIYFLDATGVRTLNRTIQEKSVPIGDISLNVRTDIRTAVTQVTPSTIKSVYHAERSFYALFFPDINTAYVFDTRVLMENGANRATVWPNCPVQCGSRTLSGSYYFGGAGGVFEYTGAEDKRWVTGVKTDFPVAMKYYTHPQTFDSPANLKFPKQVDVTIFGSTSVSMDLKWAFDYSNSYNTISLVKTGDGVAAYYSGGDEYENGAEYSGAENSLSSERFNTWGSGTNVKYGFEASISGSQFSIQEINIQALVGRLL